jgi:hypothetical protein
LSLDLSSKVRDEPLVFVLESDDDLAEVLLNVSCVSRNSCYYLHLEDLTYLDAC